MKRFFIWILPLLVACNFGEKGRAIDVNAVKIDAGIVSGKIIGDDDVKLFLGIPYAAPPLGGLRWKAPQAVQPWQGTRVCVENPPSAMQATPKPFMCWSEEFMAPQEPLSEDCLYLNIWTAAQNDIEKRPVIVWIHGGAFTSGSGTVPLYNGEALASKGVVFVTINYRLGIWGFLAHPELSAESELGVSGNYGILDQIAALKWVKKNIAAFGGNPDNITIAGQSAGAFSVNMLVVSPFARGLFHKAIAQSGGMFGKQLALGQTLDVAVQNGKAILEQSGIHSIEELRSLSSDSLLKIPGRFGLAIDHVVIPPVYETFASGQQADVPTLTGWNADDGVSFGPPPTADQFKQQAHNQYGEWADAYLNHFPANTDAEAAQSQKLASQLHFGWNNYSWARMQANKGNAPVYLYLFTRIPPGEPNYGAFHSAEFGYALHTLKFWDRPFSEIDFQLEETMSSYWINFAKNGDPNSEELPIWPPFNPENPEIMKLGDEVLAQPLPYRDQLYFLNEIN